MESREQQIERVANEIRDAFGAGPTLAEQINEILTREFGEANPDPVVLEDPRP